MNRTRITALQSQYRAALLDDIVPFWYTHGLDRECGGYLHFLDRDGSVYGTDKQMWTQCRGGIYLYAKLYNTFERKPEWLEAARQGYEFVMKHGFDTDGRMFYALARDGRPLRKRRYIFSESFCVLACAEYYKATGDPAALQKAKDVFRLMVRYLRTPGLLPPKVIPATRITKGHAVPMILLNTSQEISKVDSDPLYKEVADDALHQILHHFVRRDERIVVETVGPNGERLDSPEGRCINPGHAIESAWFIMHEGLERKDQALVRSGLEMLDWSLERGWDKEYGGILYFVDAEGRPPDQLEHDMKLWWPHAETLYATLLAHHVTGEKKWLDWFEKVHDYTFTHFPDPQYGEWFGYLHRDGSVSLPLKGNMFKGPFHISRMLWLSLALLDKMAAGQVVAGLR